MARVTVRSSSRVTAARSGRFAKTIISAVVPLRQELTPEQIDGIREAFRKAGIGFECRETDEGAYEFSFRSGDPEA